MDPVRRSFHIASEAKWALVIAGRACSQRQRQFWSFEGLAEEDTAMPTS